MLNDIIKPVVLCIIDGWGIAPPSLGNAVLTANLTNIEKIISKYPITTLHSSGESVGLLKGSVGNNQVGHLAIGTGQLIKQKIFQINDSITDKSFFKNEVFVGALNHAKKNKSSIHLLGLISKDNKYSSFNHLLSLIEILKKEKDTNSYLHLIIDDDSIQRVKEIIDFITNCKNIGIATISGYNYAMDEYNNWDKTILTFKALTTGECNDKFSDTLKAIEFYEERGINGRDINPTVLINNSKPVAKIKDKDSLIFFNFNARGMRQLCRAFSLPSIPEIPKKIYYKNSYFAVMAEYEKFSPAKVAFSDTLRNTSLKAVLTANNKRQLRITETEAYARLTYFFDGKEDKYDESDDRILIPPLMADNYIDSPKMSVNKITSTLVKEINKDSYDFIAVNYVNADVLAHIGDLNATTAGLKVIDKNIYTLKKAVLAKNGTLIITSSHGNCEEMIDNRTEEVNKDNTANPVPFIVINQNVEGKSLHKADVTGMDLSDLKPSGSLIDIAPTILKIMGIDKPKEMMGKSLI